MVPIGLVPIGNLTIVKVVSPFGCAGCTRNRLVLFHPEITFLVRIK